MVGATLDSDAFLSNIKPGNQVRVQSVFDVPPGTQPSAVEPYDAGYSGGAIVTLSQWCPQNIAAGSLVGVVSDVQ
jgi:hypothetical protein